MAVDGYSLKISQYGYFALKSDTVSASTITTHLGMRPDRVEVRGARRAKPPLPACHTWAIECRQPGLTVDELVARVLARIRPAAALVRELTADDGVSAVLQVVRYFDDDEGEQDNPGSVVSEGRVLRRLAGQHQLLGWHLAVEDLAFLASIPAALDVDKYG